MHGTKSQCCFSAQGWTSHQHNVASLLHSALAVMRALHSGSHVVSAQALSTKAGPFSSVTYSPCMLHFSTLFSSHRLLVHFLNALAASLRFSDFAENHQPHAPACCLSNSF